MKLYINVIKRADLKDWILYYLLPNPFKTGYLFKYPDPNYS